MEARAGGHPQGMAPVSTLPHGLDGFGPRGATLFQVAARLLRDRAAFVAALHAPVLVWEGASPGGDDVAATFSDPTATGGSAAPLQAGQALLFPVRKHAGHANAFPMGVTLGRLSTNDVVLPLPTVSRFHAWLQRDERAGAWLVADAQSDHGTFLGGRRLTRGHAEVLGDGAQLLLGSLALRFLTPASFVAWLEGLGQR